MGTPDWERAEAAFQVVAITRPLCSVSKMCDQDNRVVFEFPTGHVETLVSGKKTHFCRQSSVEVMDMFVQEPDSSASDGFARDGR